MNVGPVQILLQEQSFSVASEVMICELRRLEYSKTIFDGRLIEEAWVGAARQVMVNNVIMNAATLLHKPHSTRQ